MAESTVMVANAAMAPMKTCINVKRETSSLVYAVPLFRGIDLPFAHIHVAWVGVGGCRCGFLGGGWMISGGGNDGEAKDG